MVVVDHQSVTGLGNNHVVRPVSASDDWLAGQHRNLIRAGGSLLGHVDLEIIEEDGLVGCGVPLATTAAKKRAEVKHVDL